MSNRFLNDHSVEKVEIHRIIRITAGKFHAWCDSNVGIIRKPNSALVKLFCWFDFWKIEKPKVKQELIKLKWYIRFWNWILKLLKRKNSH